VTERGLFHAYRNLSGDYSAECACGGLIESPTADELAVAEAVSVHNESPVHAQWSTWQEAVHALQRPTRKPCPCHAHVAVVAS
jgi:hypothetical protein